MKTKDFNHYAEEIFRYCLDTLKEKTAEYVLDNDDRFAAFKYKWLQNKIDCINQKEILFYQLAKHITSVYDYCKQNDEKFDYEHQCEWFEKIQDCICYFALLYAMTIERAQHYYLENFKDEYEDEDEDDNNSAAE